MPWRTRSSSVVLAGMSNAGPPYWLGYTKHYAAARPSWSRLGLHNASAAPPHYASGVHCGYMGATAEQQSARRGHEDGARRRDNGDGDDDTTTTTPRPRRPATTTPFPPRATTVGLITLRWPTSPRADPSHHTHPQGSSGPRRVSARALASFLGQGLLASVCDPFRAI